MNVADSKRLLVALLLVASGGCRSAAPAKPVEVEPQSNHHAVNPLEIGDDDSDGMTVSGTLGTLDQGAIEAGLHRPLLEMNRCFNDAQSTHPYLGGRAEFSFRVDRKGTIERVSFSECTLGSLEVERCLLKAVASARFERPRGGPAEFKYALEFPPRAAPLEWNPGMVRPELEKNADALTTLEGEKSPQVPPSGLVLTFYLSPRGEVLEAGMMANEEIPEAFADHMVAALKKVAFDKPRSNYAKVTITWQTSD